MVRDAAIRTYYITLKPRGASGAGSVPHSLGALGIGDIAPPDDMTDPRAIVVLGFYRTFRTGV